jgi:hypothetical protein
MSFKKNKYQIIRGAISKEIADIAYRYLQISAEADHWMLNNSVTHEGNILCRYF